MRDVVDGMGAMGVWLLPDQAPAHPPQLPKCILAFSRTGPFSLTCDVDGSRGTSFAACAGGRMTHLSVTLQLPCTPLSFEE